MNIALGLLRSGLISCGLAGALLFGCWDTVHADGHALKFGRVPTPVARLGREFKLRARHQVALKREGLRIRFAAVKEDSRCPSDVTCVWSGNAAVRLDVSIPGRGAKTLTLHTDSGPDEDQYRGYTVKFVDLKPYPRSNRKIAPGDYVVTLLVTKH